MNNMNTQHYYILTGAMGAGKSTVLAELKNKGLTCVDEPAREILAEQRAIDGAGVPEKDAQRFTGLLLSRSIASYKHYANEKGPIIFDRGIPDNISYAELFELATDVYVDAAKHFRYHRMVFFLPGWEAIYQTDDERKMSFAQADAFGKELKAVYASLGYKIIEVPFISALERANFIYNRIKQQEMLPSIQTQAADTKDPVHFTSCLIRSANGDFLLQQRGHDWDSHPGYLCTFGGKVEAGETPMQTIIRELHEELNVTVKENELIVINTLTEPVSNHQERIATFYWHAKDTKITTCHEGELKAFTDINQILAHPKLIDDVHYLLHWYENTFTSSV